MANGTASLKEAISMFGPEYTTGQRKSILAGVGQSAVSSGLSGTTRPGAVSSGMLADLETTRRTKLAGLMSQLAQMESQERMEAERLSLSKAALAFEKEKTKKQLALSTEQAQTQRASLNPDWLQKHGVSSIIGGGGGGRIGFGSSNAAARFGRMFNTSGASRAFQRF